MAFMLPIAVGGASVVSGFVLGYYYQSSGDSKVQFVDGMTVATDGLTAKDLKKLKDHSPHKEINSELVNFDKTKLKRTETQNPSLSSDVLFLNKVRQIMIIRRQKLVS